MPYTQVYGTFSLIYFADFQRLFESSFIVIGCLHGRFHATHVKTDCIQDKAKLEANVRSVLEAAESALAMENADEQQELTSEEMAKRADRILKKMDEEGISDKKMRRSVEKVKSSDMSPLSADTGRRTAPGAH